MTYINRQMTGHVELADRLADLIADGMVWPGDCILYRYAAPTWIQRRIARIQQRAIDDLFRNTDDPIEAMDPRWDCPACQAITTPATYTHAGMVAGAQYTVEMTSPCARLMGWPERMRGVGAVAIVRPAGSPRRRLLLQAAAEGREDVLRGVRYPYRELALYWLWSWGFRKLRGKTPFSRVFQSRKRNVCSGSVINWWQRAGIDLGLHDLDVWPEAWYPARLLADSRFRLVAHLTIFGDRSTLTKIDTDSASRQQPDKPGSAIPVSFGPGMGLATAGVSPSCCAPDRGPSATQGDQPVAPTSHCPAARRQGYSITFRNGASIVATAPLGQCWPGKHSDIQGV
jgi:hypothetical protein